MIQTVLQKVFGTKNERELKRLRPYVSLIGDFEPKVKTLTDDQLRSYFNECRERFDRGETDFQLLPEVFAIVREAARRTLNMRHFDVQLIGGIVLYEGKISEMKTGEGKTLVATLPLVLNSLSKKGGHLVTVNDYLAKRDAEWMGAIYKFLGLTVGVIVHGLDDQERKASYAADITYGTNHEFGFDYLRDNMKLHLGQFVQRGFKYCIVDEVDSILIDEARTPLIISGASEDTTEKYYTVNRIIPGLKETADYTVDEKDHLVALTEEGVHTVERLLGVQNLYDPQHIDLVHHVDQALRAHKLFKLDRDYIIKDGEVIIVDEFTGRLAEGRRYSDGLHQALEAKEGVNVESENQTLASITYQNYFRMYSKLAGMTGTADTEAAEFKEIYGLDVIVVPTNEPMIRMDHGDQIYKSETAKFNAVVREIRELNEVGRPVLVGTISIEKSEILSKLLKREGVPHHVLNAKHHELEAQIVAQAGQRGAVTIATNMAGRGTDIKLGEGIAALGGLHITGTERHEARRIDNQLRGRSGRQGDPGSSRFYLSLEDDLLRIFGGERILRIMETLKMEEDVPIEHGMISRAIENAQKRLEGRNFDIRKHLLKYDDVMNDQRKVVYGWRRRIIENEDNREDVLRIFEEMIEGILDEYVPPKAKPQDWEIDGISKVLMRSYGFGLDRSEIQNLVNDQELFEFLTEKMRRVYDEKEREITPPLMRHIEHVMLLQTIDERWRQHLQNMDHLREGINLRGYAQKDPLNEYKTEGFHLFESMIWQIKTEVGSNLFKVKLSVGPSSVVDELDQKQREQEERVRRLNYLHGPAETAELKPVRRKDKKIGRNDPCFCGSGKKFKKCHGVNA